MVFDNFRKRKKYQTRIHGISIKVHGTNCANVKCYFLFFLNFSNFVSQKFRKKENKLNVPMKRYFFFNFFENLISHLVCFMSNGFEYDKNITNIREIIEKSNNPPKIWSRLNAATFIDNKFKEELNKIFYKNGLSQKSESKFMRIKSLPTRQDVTNK